MECAYCVAIMLICLNVSLIFVIGSLSVVSSIFIEEEEEKLRSPLGGRRK